MDQLPALIETLKTLEKQESARKKTIAQQTRGEAVARKTATTAAQERNRLALEQAKTDLADAQATARRVVKGFPTTTTAADVEKANTAVEVAQSRVAVLSGTTKTPTPVITPQGPRVAAPPGARPQPAVTTTATGTTTATEIPTDGKTSTAAGVAGKAAQTSNKKKAAPPTSQTSNKNKAAPPTSDEQLLNQLAERFPAYRDWSSEQVRAYFGADLVNILLRINNPNHPEGALDSTTAEGRQGIERLMRQTGYWLNTEKSVREWDAMELTARTKKVNDQKELLAQNFGDLALSDAVLTDIATQIVRLGQTEIGAKQLVFSKAFQRAGSAAGDSRALALKGADADRIRQSVRAYGMIATDAEIEAILTGQAYGPGKVVLTEDALIQKAQVAAKGQYSHLSDQIDAGLTLDDIFGNYKRYAASILQKDPSEIDFTNPLYAEAFGSKETGQLSLNDWTRKLKSDSRYGWQFTDEANQQVNSVVSTLERAFGLVK
jgi:glucan-binding YG repeat protein